jgi:TolA-binding protein
MKRPKQILSVISLLLLSVAPYACTPTAERPIEDSFFAPLDTVSRKSAKSARSPGTAIDSQAIIADENMKKSIAGNILDQDRRLNEVIERLDRISGVTPDDSLHQNKYGKYSTDFVLDKKISNEVLLEMIKGTNRKLEDVAERINILTNDRKNISIQLDSLRADLNRNQIRKNSQTVVPGSPYDMAIRLYKQRKYKDAIAAFRALLNDKVEVPLQDNCHFWIGVCNFIQKRPNSAIAEFMKVVDTPDSDKKEGAYFMMGQCYEQMGLKPSARKMFNKTIRDYPDGDLRQAAEIKLALLR